MRGLAVVLTVGISVLAIGCEAGEQEMEQTGRDAPADTRSAAQAGDSAAHDTHDTAQSASGEETDSHAHGGTGEPQLLLPIMQQLGTDMVTLTHGLMTDSAELVAHAAEAIANHPPIAQDDIERIHRTLGERMQEFERLDEEVHERSVQLHEAAAAGNTDEVLRLLNEVQRGCVECHTQFREQLRTNTGQ